MCHVNNANVHRYVSCKQRCINMCHTKSYRYVSYTQNILTHVVHGYICVMPSKVHDFVNLYSNQVTNGLVVREGVSVTMTCTVMIWRS